mmetsp:Transcript_38812/g.51146  ORF Transcript_38812/g.51146 Transcript_38812/m.51146 type:complete len:300 (-) Transcript_38812:334-1233(-)
MAGRRRQQGGGIAAVQQLAQERLQQGEEGAYEALQLFRGQCARRLKKGREDYPGAIEIATVGAQTLFDAGFLDMGADLAIYVVQLYADSKREVTDTNRDVMVELDKKFEPNSNKRLKFIKAAVKWSLDCGARAYGDPALHFRLGDAFLRKNQVELCTKHFVYAEQPLLIAHLLCNPQINDDSREVLVCRSMLHFMSLENLRDANRLMMAYLKSIEDGKINPPSPGHLVMFCKYLSKTCERDAAPLFQELVQRYESILGAHPDLNLYVGHIAERYFGLVRQGGGSMLENMMKMFIGGDGP